MVAVIVGVAVAGAGVLVGCIVGVAVANSRILTSGISLPTLKAEVGVGTGVEVGKICTFLPISTKSRASTSLVIMANPTTNTPAIISFFIWYIIILKMIIIKNGEQIDGIRRSSQLAAATLSHTAGFVRPGISTEFLNQQAHRFILDHHAIPAPLNYNGFPKSICTSVNNVVCHGIPSAKQVLQQGDIINIDITTILDSFYGDVSATFPVGQIDRVTAKLIQVTQESLNLAIKSLAPGKPLNLVVGKTINDYVTSFGYSPVRLLGGHGVGLKFHEDPFVFHYYRPSDTIVLKPGMVFTIEPMINASLNWEVDIDKTDGWTVRTRDGSLSCQFEHTVLITDSGYEVLTKL